ncbi:MATE family efflux transporter [Sphingobacterium bovistauri]|uniref:Multidrug-efflux transporter n=1 Tax=Sphingobacterium bovistauri TaxID=2781959 RepID=A0ABS7Z9E1_9SPHI|nr:MATE family efflux transporter [Sphingobacterium bovistauri]MCA5006177.1 MATE family efflux transporter [Sphingobacterium bovistauri]
MLHNIKKHKPYYISALSLAGPIIIAQLGHTLVQTSDTMIIGQFLGKISLAASSLAHSVFMMVLVFGLGIAYGLTPLIAQANGKSDKIECAKLLSNSLWINFIASLFLFCGVYYGSMYGMQHADQDPAVVDEAKPYLIVLSMSIFPLMIFNAFKQFAEGLGFTKQAMRITIWGNVLNVVLAIIFVKGMFGIKPMGISGVGLATLIDRILMMVVMMAYVLKSKNFKDYTIHFSFLSVQTKRIKSILKLGTPVAFQYVFEVSAFAGASLIAGKIGALEQASHNVAITLASMTYMMATGISAATTIKVGNSYGRGKFERLNKFASVSYKIVLVFMIFTATIFAVFSDTLASLMTTDPEVIALAGQLLIIAGLFQLFDGTQVIGLGILRGIGDVNIPTLITLLAYWAVGLPIGYYMGVILNWGIQGVWYGLTLALLTSSILLYFRYKYMVNKKLANISY